MSKESCYRTITLKDLDVFAQETAQLPSGSLCLFDVDDTLIVPEATVFRSRERQTPVHTLKTQLRHSPTFPERLSHWRLKRRVMLIDTGWPTALQELHARRMVVYGLTQMQSGSFGSIPRMEVWRADEMRKMNLMLTSDCEGEKDFAIPRNQTNEPHFFDGVIVTGSQDLKGPVFEALLALKGILPPHVVFVDDREDQVASIGESCRKLNIPYTGFVCQIHTVSNQVPNPQVVEHQAQRLLQDGVWLEDDEAQAELLNR